MKPLILVVDPDESSLTQISTVLSSEEYNVVTTAPGQELLSDSLLNDPPDLLLIDVDAVDTRLLENNPETPVLYLVSSERPADSPLPPAAPSCHGYLGKGSLEPSLLIRTVETAIMRSRREHRIARDYQSYRFFFDNIPIASIVSDPDYTIRHWNLGAQELFGYSAEEAVGRDLTALLYSKRNDQTQEELKHTLLGSLQTNRKHLKVNYDRTKEGWDILCEWHDFPYHDDERQLILSVATDITEHRALVDTLKTTITQKEFLMQEIYHRLKNNLNMIGSLIHLKIDEVESKPESDNASTAEVLQDVEQKVSAFSILYDMLHQHGGNIGSLNLSHYLKALLDTVFSSMSGHPCTIETEFDDVYVEPQQAVILGLITNEIATNALKHGMLPQGDRRFSVSLQLDSSRGDGKRCIFTLANSGRPFPEGVNVTTTRSLGLRLIFSLVDQLAGTVTLRKSPTPRYTIEFPVP